MFKHSQHLYRGAEHAPTVVGWAWFLRPTVVLARHLCVHFSLDATGVPRRRSSEFVGLQARRLSPFAETGGAFVRQRNLLHVWVWPKAIEDAARAAIGAATDPQLRVVPETLLGAAMPDGVVLQPCVEGYEGLKFEGGALRDCAWWNELPGTDVQKRWAGSVAVHVASTSAIERITAGAFWARSWQPLPQSGAGHAGAGRSAMMRGPGLPVLGWAGLAVALAALGWALREQQLLQATHQQVQRQLDSRMAVRQAPQSVVKVLAEDTRWLAEVRAATRSPNVSQALQGLARALVDGGFLLREFTFERGDVKLTLVSGIGATVDLESAVTALEASGLWSRVELLDIANPLAVRFNLQPRDFLFESAVQ